jgi:molecular chaperone HscA
MAALREVASGDDHHAINAAIEALANSTEEFAAERMNRGIQRAFAGRSVEDI